MRISSGFDLFYFNIGGWRGGHPNMLIQALEEVKREAYDGDRPKVAGSKKGGLQEKTNPGNQR